MTTLNRLHCASTAHFFFASAFSLTCAILFQTPPGFSRHTGHPTDTGKQVDVERSEWTSGGYSPSLIAYL